MQKKLLFMLIAILAGTFMAQAASVSIDVDVAANVVVKTGGGYGDEITLQDGVNTVDLADDVVLGIAAADNGAEIVSVTYNGDALNPSGGGAPMYRRGVSDGGAFVIRTKSPEPAKVNFTIDVDVAANVTVATDAGYGTVINLTDGVNAVSLNADEAQPLAITPVSPATIDKVTVNGEEKNITPDGVIRWSFAEGDQWVIRTNTPSTKHHITVTVDHAANVEVSTSAEILPLTDGTQVYEVTPDAQPLTVRAANGATITRCEFNGTAMNKSGDGAYRSAWTDYGMLVIETNGGAAADGVTIDVDAASRVVIAGGNGRLEPLTLKDGSNNFTFDEIKNGNPYELKAAEECEIVSVSLNNEDLTPNHNGGYVISFNDKDQLKVVSKEKPAFVPLAITNVGSWDKLTVKIDGKVADFSADNSMMDVAVGAVVSLTPANGYEISMFMPSISSLEYTQNNGTYTFVMPDRLAITLNVQMKTASEGNSLVILNLDDPYGFVTIEELDETGAWTKRIFNNNNSYEVKNNYKLKLYIIHPQIHFTEVTANGEAVTVTNDDSEAIVDINGTTEIKATLYSTIYLHGDAVSKGTVLISLNGAEPTQTVYARENDKIVLSAKPAAGYQLDYIYTNTYVNQDYEHPIVNRWEVGKEYEVGEILNEGEFEISFWAKWKDDDRTFYTIKGSVFATKEITDSEYTEDDVVGLVYFIKIEDSYFDTTGRGYEGDKVTFRPAIWIDDPVRVEYYYVVKDDQVKKITEPYAINPADADQNNNIIIYAKAEIFGSGIQDVETTGAEYYDAATKSVKSQHGASVYDTAGHLVASSAETTLSVASLPSGIYIVKTAGKTFKFVK